MVEATTVARLLARHPTRFGGVHLRCPADATRAAWLDALRAALPADLPWVRVPVNAGADALLGGLDLAATLAASRPVVRRGLLARAHGGFLVLAMAERAAPLTLACLQQAMDDGQVRVEREGFCAQVPARFGVIVLDEGHEEVSTLPGGLLDRLAFGLDEAALARWQTEELALTLAETDALAEFATDLRGSEHASEHPAHGAPIAEASGAVSAVSGPAGADALLALCASAWQLGIASLRAPIQAASVAQAWAELSGRDSVSEEDILLAGTLVFSARARLCPIVDELPPCDDAGASADRAPAPEPPVPAEADAAAGPPPDSEATPPESAPPPIEAASPPAELAPAPKPENPPAPAGAPDPDALVDSVLSSLPADLLGRLMTQAAAHGSGRVYAERKRRGAPPRHGRPVGSRAGDPRHGAPLDLLATLRAALPWQRLRAPAPSAGARIAIRSGDLRVRTLKPRTRSTAVFAVDASGSAALHRLNEAKGAVESLLAQCYVRRDQVALISFRGAGAEVLLPPTRSLARVRRELSALPGGGGTPLASGIALAEQMGAELRRRGDAPLLVLLTDGRANVSRDGVGGRARAEQEAFAAATAVGQRGLPILLVDIAPLPQERARLLARAMNAEYLPLPAAGAERLASAVQARLPSLQQARRG